MSQRVWTHVHTLVSGDSSLSHEEVRAAATRCGIRAVLLTEHREVLTDRAVAVAASRCRALSDHRVVLVPGLEICTEERRHVLAVGVDGPLPGGPTESVVRDIREAGGWSVLAHPSRGPRGWERDLPAYDAVETWNRRYDGPFGPDPEVAARLRELRGPKSLFGLDAHGPGSLRERRPELLVDARTPTEGGIREALSEGRFRTALAGKTFEGRGLIRRLLHRLEREARRAVRGAARTANLRDTTRRRWSGRW